MSTWILVSTIVVCTLMEYFFHRRFNNRHIDRLCTFVFMAIVGVLIIYAARFDGLQGLAFVAAILIANAIYEIRKLNLTKEDK
ncbi:hypothetical protein [Staphylococcus chromogenes]|uniref:hypothetical protein n=1 Tax=Staphylococcus chromogenes TaxID=46126 RepID=UPI000D1AA265|nr:hypothetical protein [Staphylococcus chromogenes]PTG53502.1 hypothetical protein BU687_04980 [Staphylococcus chromogenes]PTG98986.1 hypothetical protein BU636_10335 [Staphylococcus chromogenes]